MIGRPGEERAGLGGAPEAWEAKSLEPVRRALTGQSLGRCCSHSRWPLAAREGGVVEDEAPSIEVTRTGLPTEEASAAQPARDVFDQRARTREVSGERAERPLGGIAGSREVSRTVGCPRPIRLGFWQTAVQRQPLTPRG